MPRFSPPTPRSRRLGRALKKLRTARERDLSLEKAAALIASSPARLSRIESGEIKARPGDVMEILVAYELSVDSEPGASLIEMARQLRETAWWSHLDQLPNKYVTFIAYEAEAALLRNFEPLLVPGLLQTEDYARAVSSVGREADEPGIDQRVTTRLRRQQVLHRRPAPLKFHAIVSEAALHCEVGDRDVLRQQLRHIANVSRLSNVTVQVLPFAAGAELADRHGFAILTFEREDPTLGYTEMLTGQQLLSGAQEVARLDATYDHLRKLALSPAESASLIRKRADQI
ncbi:helix-turn-helix domain-containing protein [Fodinicola acaciae]|uniref:helix-turn-helix domain-containing protein n=1 Tax=Fodinicola acaciae TaxID=2681555 RepID=UPI0013D6D33E|nr:helix-turn-helix transcriptional regulator [Fodinicola acaciae]